MSFAIARDRHSHRHGGRHRRRSYGAALSSKVKAGVIALAVVSRLGPYSIAITLYPVKADGTNRSLRDLTSGRHL
jgi:hypothetical protein